MDDFIIRLTDKTHEDRNLDKMIDDVNEVVALYGFRARQWGTFDNMARSMTLESKFIEELLDAVKEN